MKTVPKELIDHRKYTSALLKNAKDFLTDLFSQTFSKTLTVRVENTETALFKEIAANSRGVKGRLDTLIKQSSLSLSGIPKSTLVKVNSKAQPLPETPLPLRSSLVVFNDSPNTIYLGGSDVSTASGLPVLKQSYSPSINAGEKMVLYAIADKTSNVRVFEVSSSDEVTE